MITREIINNGLSYSLASLDITKDNVSIISRDKDNNISLTFHFSGLDCSLRYGDNRVSSEIQFVFQFQYLDIYFSQSCENYYHEFSEYKTQDICCSKQMILHEIIKCKFQGPYRKMFLESKALALLLCFSKSSAISNNDCASCKFLVKPLEKDKIFKAREILLIRLSHPPTIPELSLEVGINQCYLKKGFKEVFGITVYDFVQEQRMLKAKLLLITSDFTVSEVAGEIGFSSISNFSSAFKKYTGVFPSEMQKN